MTKAIFILFVGMTSIATPAIGQSQSKSEELRPKDEVPMESMGKQEGKIDNRLERISQERDSLEEVVKELQGKIETSNIISEERIDSLREERYEAGKTEVWNDYMYRRYFVFFLGGLLGGFLALCLIRIVRKGLSCKGKEKKASSQIELIKSFKTSRLRPYLGTKKAKVNATESGNGKIVSSGCVLVQNVTCTAREEKDFIDFFAMNYYKHWFPQEANLEELFNMVSVRTTFADGSIVYQMALQCVFDRHTGIKTKKYKKGMWGKVCHYVPLPSSKWS